jgi:apolipoprotein D and lipocalin family protein
MLNKTMALFAATLASSLATAAEVTPVATVDVPRYMGLWYEIASIPQIFQTGCRNTTATYTLQEDGSVEVVNQCRLFWSSGFPLSATGRATIPNSLEPGKLKVSFFGSQADYWILALANDYSYALVGDPSRRSLWILSREKTMSDATYEKLVTQAKDQQFDIGRLKRSVQE